MTKNISQRDWEAISAYLDNQLKPRDRSRPQDKEYNNISISVRQSRIRENTWSPTVNIDQKLNLDINSIHEIWDVFGKY